MVGWPYGAQLTTAVTTLEWSPLTPADLDALVGLARACLIRDGGLPLLVEPDFLTALLLAGEGLAGRDETGDIVAAAALDGLRRTATGLVHPSLRRQGIGEQLVSWCRERATGPLQVRIENVSPEAESLMADARMTRVMAETVMRHRLREIPSVPLPDGVVVEPFGPETAALFHAAYRASFGDRPGFPDPPLAAWVASLSEDGDFRPADSRVALADGDPAGFVTLSTDWVDQVGVVPPWRGRGLGAHLVARSLTALRKAGSKRVWLCVAVDNPAHELYLRLGFKDRGHRALYQQT